MHAYNYAYEYIRDQILNGKYEPNTKLTEERLAEEIGISRTPIRTAIMQLEQEGLIKNKRVFSPTAKDIRDIFQVRILLEGFASKYCANYISEEALQRLQKCIEIGYTGTVEEVMEANFEFHQIIVEETRNPLIIDIINKMQSIIYLFRKTVVYHKRPHLIDEHKAIYNAIKNHDEQLAERLMVEHLQKDLDFSLGRINM